MKEEELINEITDFFIGNWDTLETNFSIKSPERRFFIFEKYKEIYLRQFSPLFKTALLENSKIREEVSRNISSLKNSKYEIGVVHGIFYDVVSLRQYL